MNRRTNACLRSGRRPNRHDVVTRALEEKLLRHYDDIVTLKDGCVAETGTFDELMAKKGLFLCALYRDPLNHEQPEHAFYQACFRRLFA